MFTKLLNVFKASFSIVFNYFRYFFTSFIFCGNLSAIFGIRFVIFKRFNGWFKGINWFYAKIEIIPWNLTWNSMKWKYMQTYNKGKSFKGLVFHYCLVKSYQEIDEIVVLKYHEFSIKVLYTNFRGLKFLACFFFFFHFY